MGADYIPERDHAAAMWMNLLAQKVAENPGLYEVSAAEATEAEQAAQAYWTLYQECAQNPAHPYALKAEKNRARKAAERLVRPIAQRIRSNPQIDDEVKMAIGLRPRRQRRRHVGPPESVPRLYVKAEVAGQVIVRVLDSVSLRRGRPSDTIGMELWEQVLPKEAVRRAKMQAMQAGESEASRAPGESGESGNPGNPGAGEVCPWHFVGLYTRSPLVRYPAVTASGDVVMFKARWVTRRGEPGPFGPEASLRMGPITHHRGDGIDRDARRAAA